MLKIEGLGEVEKEPVKEEPSEQTFTITQLTSGVRDTNRVNVHINYHFAFSLDIAQVVNMHVKVGQVLSADRLKELLRA